MAGLVVPSLVYRGVAEILTGDKQLSVYFCLPPLVCLPLLEVVGNWLELLDMDIVCWVARSVPISVLVLIVAY